MWSWSNELKINTWSGIQITVGICTVWVTVRMYAPWNINRLTFSETLAGMQQSLGMMTRKGQKAAFQFLMSSFLDLLCAFIEQHCMWYAKCVVALCLFSVHTLGGCSDLCVQPGEWDQLPGCVQSLCQDGAVPGHQGDSPYPCRHTGSVAFLFSLCIAESWLADTARPA